MALVTPVDPVPLDDLGQVHFIGIGGAGMSGIARIMIARGITVSGSDAAAGPVLEELAGAGARVHAGHAAGNVAGADSVVFSSAIRPDNPELAEARRRGLRVLHRAAALASLMLGQRGVAVAGTHGKTTTTSLLVAALREAGADPGYVIGGVFTATGTGAQDGGGDVFVAEADESDASFLMLSPQVAIVTCIEADHLDNYPSLADIEAAFAAFTRRIVPGGTLIACADDPGARALGERARAEGIRVRTYGESPGADYRVSGVTPEGMALRLEVAAGPGAVSGAPALTRLRLAIPGRHNGLNGAAAYAAALELGLAPGPVCAGLAACRGARRRMEPKGEAAGVLVLDSYAHHPSEVAADLRTARDIRGGGRVIAVFQPHLFSRTRIFAADFGTALGAADEVLVLDVYAAREDPEPGVSGELVSAAVPGGRARFLPAREDVPRAVAGTARPGDLVLTMGAGDVTALGPLIVAALGARAGTPA